jgi:signal transduction histidine kinase
MATVNVPRTTAVGCTDHGRAPPRLTNIHDRLVAVGGSLVVESHQGRGTRVAGTIPLTTSV